MSRPLNAKNRLTSVFVGDLAGTPTINVGVYSYHKKDPAKIAEPLSFSDLAGIEFASLIPPLVEFYPKPFNCLRQLGIFICQLSQEILCRYQIKTPSNFIGRAFVIWLGLEPRTHTLKVYCSTN